MHEVLLRHACVCWLLTRDAAPWLCVSCLAAWLCVCCLAVCVLPCAVAGVLALMTMVLVFTRELKERRWLAA